MVQSRQTQKIQLIYFPPNPRKPQFCLYGKRKRLICRVADMIWISSPRLIGDIPLSPGDVPRD